MVRSGRTPRMPSKTWKDSSAVSASGTSSMAANISRAGADSSQGAAPACASPLAAVPLAGVGAASGGGVETMVVSAMVLLRGQYAQVIVRPQYADRRAFLGRHGAVVGLAYAQQPERAPHFQHPVIAQEQAR